MTNDTRSPAEIERDIERQRADLSSNLENLQDKFSIDTIVRQIGDQFREHGGDMGRSISDQVKANPIPLALTGIGLAWMMFGNAQKSDARDDSRRTLYDDDSSGTERRYRQSRLDQGRPYTPPASYASTTQSGPSWSHDDDDGYSVTDRLSDGAAATRDKAGQAGTAVKDGIASATSTVSGAASATGSAMADGARSVKNGLASAGSRIADGTETLTEEGRQRVVAARQKAVQMRHRAAHSVGQGSDAAADFYDRQPLVIGALALAVGAALGGALPRTKTEDDLMGAQSDKLVSEAERIFEEEKTKALAVAKSVKDEVADIAAETKADLDRGAPGDKSALQAVGDQAKSMAGRVGNAAKSTAKDEDLGNPKT